MLILESLLKNISLIVGILGGAIGLISVFYGLIQKNRIKNIQKKQKEKEQYTEELIEITAAAMSEHFYSKEEHDGDLEEVIRKFNTETNAINNKLDRVIRRQDKTESLRIKNDIVAAADDVRAGLVVSETRFLALEESYRYYTDVLKKNSFVQKEFEFISNNFYKQKHGDNNENN